MMQLHTTQTRDPRLASIRHCVLALIFALLATLVVCAAPFATKAYAADPIEISTPEQLAAMKTGDSKVSYILTADIDLSNYTNWKPIGVPSNYRDDSGTGFMGTLDGNGHTIRNLSIESFSENPNKNVLYAGLFGCTNGATISNLTLENAFVSGAYSHNGNTARDLAVGALVGLSQKSNFRNCNIINVTVTDKFAEERTDTSNYAIGGMVGDYYTNATMASKSITNCSVSNATVTAQARFGNFAVNGDSVTQAFTGGIVGRLREQSTNYTVHLERCWFEGDVSGPGFVGPFVGGARKDTNQKTAEAISSFAAEKSINCSYSGSFTGLDGNSPNVTYNRGADIWDASWNYLKTTATNQTNALNFLNAKLGTDDKPWRIASLGNGSALVLDHRSAIISSSSLSGGMANFTASISGTYSDTDDGTVRFTWSVDDQPLSEMGLTFATPITNAEQKVTMKMLDAQSGAELATATATIAPAQIEAAVKKTRDDNGATTSVYAELKTIPDGFSETDFEYAWYGVKDGQEDTFLGSGTTLERSAFGGFENIKGVVRSSQTDKLASEAFVNVNTLTIYISLSKGSDNNSGFSPESPVREFQTAYSKLKEKEDGGTWDNNIIVVMDAYREIHDKKLVWFQYVYDDVEYGYDKSTFNKPATITSYDADFDKDYRNGGATLEFWNMSHGDHSGGSSEKIKGKLLFADTRFKDITLSANEAPKDDYKIGYIYCQGYSLTIDTGVAMEGYKTASQSSYALLSGTNVADFNIVAGYPNWNEPVGSGYKPGDKGQCEILLKSGSYARVVGGGRNFDGAGGPLNSTSRNQFASEDEPFSVSITVDIAEDQSQTNTKYTADVAQLCGGQTDGTIYTNSILTLKNGKVPLIIGANIGYARNVNSGGTHYPNNDFIGTVQINVEGGSVCQLYGGCLGRQSGGSEKVDARFRSFSNPEQRPKNDIEINISGGSIGEIGNDIKPSLTGVFAAGAGGMTGKLHDDESSKKNDDVNVAVNISGGSIKGSLYGGGYGQSSGVPIDKAAYVCLEAGNLYGNSKVNITGGTIEGDIYGGGAGTDVYLEPKPDSNKLAQIVGDVSLSISNATINGNVYGGSQGLAVKYRDDKTATDLTTTEMAKITGNVTLSIENSQISGSVYGGSALGTVTGDVTTTLIGDSDTSSVGESVYGGGQGAIVSGYDIDQQNLVGQVGGNATLSVSGYQVGGTVFGGGAIGPVLGQGGVKTTISNSTVDGFVYGGGEGATDASFSVDLQSILGKVAGPATLDISNTTIGGTVFGGGKVGPVLGAAGVKTTIADSNITGSVYGGGEGSVAAGGNTEMQEILGQVAGGASLDITNTSIDANVYGGGAYGQVGGNVATTLIGTNNDKVVGGSIYGGGEGSYQAGNSVEQQTLIGKVGGAASLTIKNYQVGGSIYGGGKVGPVLGSRGATTNLENLTAGGSIYGGGEGITVEDNTNRELQTILGQVNGNATLTLNNANVDGSVYGGGSKGAVFGSATTQVHSSRIGPEPHGEETPTSSLYAAGEGEYLGADNSDQTLQTLVGWVTGNVSLTLDGGSTVTGNVFGGGNLGAVGDGILSSGSVPYEVRNAATVTVFVDKASVGGSIFGGGAGSALAGGQMPRLLGAVFGTSKVTVREANVAADVFGGGDQSYTYAPLDVAGHPQQATSVIVNDSDAIYVYEDDGRVAETAGNGVRLVDDAPGTATTQRTINLGGSVFGGGNIADAHTVAANNNTVYGNTEVFVKGQNVNFTNEQRGGVYGDGNLSRAYGTRNVTLIGLKTPAENNTFKAKSFFSIQRTNRAIVHDCNIFLRGARDLVNESDTTVYSLNRVDNLKIYNGSSLQFETVVNGLGNLYSDVLPDRTFTSDWDGLAVGEFGDNLTAAELASYRDFAEGKASSWTDAKGQRHAETNTIIVNNGKWLDVKESADTSNAVYGEVKGLFSLYSSTAADGGAFVFGRMEPQDSPGAFISLNRDMKAEGTPYLNLYTKQTNNASNAPCRIWFIRGDKYVFERDLKAYTTSGEVSIGFLLPVEQIATETVLKLNSDIKIDENLSEMKRTADDDGRYKVSMTMGREGGVVSTPLNFYEDAKQSGWSFNYGSYLPAANDPGLVPVSIDINIADSVDDKELDTQRGTVEFTLATDDGKLYEFKINLIIERAYALASKLVHHGRVYESIAVENTAPITPTSAYTMQFTTTYSPGAYRSEVKSKLTAYTTESMHGENHDGTFPKGTKITMVDITNPTTPVYYYYEVDPQGGEKDISLTKFTKMTDDTPYKSSPSNTVIVEDLLFIVDYSKVNPSGTTSSGDILYNGHDSGNTYMALNHVYEDKDGAEHDILRYKRQNAETKEWTDYYNTLWSPYEISGTTTDTTYLKNPQFQNPDGGAPTSRVKTGHTDNFMYDTYTTRLVINPQTTVASTLFNEGEVMLQLSLWGSNDGSYFNTRNQAFPLGTKVIISRPDGSVVESRYFHESTFYNAPNRNIGYIMANLGNRLSEWYTVEIQVSRYVEGGSLYFDSGFNWGGYNPSVTFQIDADLFVSSNGLYRPQGGSINKVSASFNAARDYQDPLPNYEIKSNSGKKDLLVYSLGAVKGEITLKNVKKNEDLDAMLVVLRHTLDGAEPAVNILDVGGTITREVKPSENKITFTIGDKPPSGEYKYAIQIGNTVYYQEITVP